MEFLINRPHCRDQRPKTNDQPPTHQKKLSFSLGVEVLGSWSLLLLLGLVGFVLVLFLNKHKGDPNRANQARARSKDQGPRAPPHRES